MSVDLLELVRELTSRLDVVEKRQEETDNAIEDLFYSLINSKLTKQSIQDVVELSVLEYFGVKRKAFLGDKLLKVGRPCNVPSENANVYEARKWFMSIMRNVLKKNDSSMNKNYPFFSRQKQDKHQPVYNGAIMPKTAQDKENRAVLYGISEIVKRICREEGVLSEDFNYL